MSSSLTGMPRSLPHGYEMDSMDNIIGSFIVEWRLRCRMSKSRLGPWNEWSMWQEWLNIRNHAEKHISNGNALILAHHIWKYDASSRIAAMFDIDESQIICEINDILYGHAMFGVGCMDRIDHARNAMRIFQN